MGNHQEIINSANDIELNELISTCEKKLDYLYDRKHRPEFQHNVNAISENIEYWTKVFDASVDELKRRTNIPTT